MPTRIAAPVNPTRDTETKLRDATAAIAAGITAMQAIRDGAGNPTRAELRELARTMQDVLRAERLLVSYALRDYTSSGA